ncbi:MAG: cyclic nucleotide-binding domain-containing protein [bacterium]
MSNATVDPETLRTKTIFVGLTDEQLGRILAVSRQGAALPGEVIIRENEPGDKLYVLLEGKVEVRHAGVRGETVLTSLEGRDALAAQYEGDFFGEMALFDLEPRSATVIAVEKCSFLILARDDLAELFAEDAAMHVTLFGNIARILSRRLRTANVHFG